ncbi:MAG TPA: long-chain fatty acid--CoA ligase [Candidatus Krumholzibacteria bacterium]|nr:long-chain fatty acid--CoA ligase [Candidatus Krumholzibacteria bacterium]
MRVPEVDWLAKWAVYTPRQRFLRDHAGDREWGFAAMDGRVRALALALARDHGVQAGDRVAVLARNRVETVALWLACVKLGAILTPFNFRLTAPELQVLVDDCEPALLWSESASDAVAAGLTLPAGCARLDLAMVDSLLNAEAPAGADARFDARTPDDPVMILYTSGTTGTPKGALIDHRMLFWNAVNTNLRLDLTSADHTQSYAPFFHTGGWNVLFTPFLQTGASHTVLEGFDADLLLELIERERSTLLFGVPTMLQMLADAPGFAGADLSSLRYAIVGGAAMPLDLIDVWHGRGVPIRQGYGLTEVGPNCFSLHQDDAVRKRGSIGFPNFHVAVRVVDDDGRDCGVDEPGELWLKGDNVTPGYWRRPQETAAAMSDGWFRTGDMVRRDDEGFTFVVDRKKNMYISGGENVYPAEVEAVLASHPDVREAAVIGVPDDRWGEAGRAFLVPEPGRELDVAQVRAHCDGRLARYKIPRDLAVLDELPRNQAGKIDRPALSRLNPEKENPA